MIFKSRELIRQDIIDYENDIKKLYLTLTNDNKINSISINEMVLWYDEMKQSNNKCFIMLVIQEKKGSGTDFEIKICGIITILIETKLIHGYCKVGHIEDIVINSEYRGNNLGRSLLKKAVDYTQEIKCYKVILNCNNDLINYYKNSGFLESNTQMSIYFK